MEIPLMARFVQRMACCLRRDCAFAALLAALVAAGCSEKSSTTEATGEAASDTDPAKSGDRKFTLVMIPKATQATFWNQVRSGAERAADEFDVELTWKGPARENDRAEQKKVLQQFTNEGVDGILLAPLDRMALAGDVKTVMDKGIPVLIFDSGLDGEAGKDFISYVATDNLEAGKLGGKHVMELIGEGGKAVLFRHMEGQESTTNREEGALSEFKAGKADILSDSRYSGETSIEAQNTALNMIDVIREAQGIFASNQTSAEGLLLALRQQNLTGKVKFVGFDSSPLLIDGLKNGHIDALVVQDPVNMGYTAVKMMVQHLKGEKIEPLVRTETHLVTRDNMADPEIATLLQ
jgi:ribose transport system substrate-binding protein